MVKKCRLNEKNSEVELVHFTTPESTFVANTSYCFIEDNLEIPKTNTCVISPLNSVLENLNSSLDSIGNINLPDKKSFNSICANKPNLIKKFVSKRKANKKKHKFYKIKNYKRKFKNFIEIKLFKGLDKQNNQIYQNKLALAKLKYKKMKKEAREFKKNVEKLKDKRILQLNI